MRTTRALNLSLSAILGIVLAVVLLAAPGWAVLVDQEPGNDDIPTTTARFINTGVPKSDAGLFFLSPDDDDFVSLGTLRRWDTITVLTSPLGEHHGFSQQRPRCRPWNALFEGETGCFGVPDTIIEIWTEIDTNMAEGDDSENSDFNIEDHGSLIRFQVVEDKEYFVNIYGFDAQETGEYLLSITVEPNIQCGDGFDNDADGLIDLADPQCRNLADASERSDCDDELDNDADGLPDAEDPGCTMPTRRRENPECQDGIDNDGDGRIDFDGGVSIYGFAVADPDPQCIDAGTNKEKFTFCGLGLELALLLPPMLAVRRRRERAEPACEVRLA